MKEIIEKLKTKGVTLTPQRIAIVNVEVDCPIIKKGWVEGCKVEESQAYLY